MTHRPGGAFGPRRLSWDQPAPADLHDHLDPPQEQPMPRTPAQDQARDAVVLAQHYRVSTGMTHGSPDECACGVRSLPRPGDEDVSVRRARRFAEHQAAMLAEARSTTTTIYVHAHDDEPCAPDPTETYQCAAHGAQVVEVYV